MALGWECRTSRVPGFTLVLHRATAGADTGAHRVEAPLIAVAIAGNCSTILHGSETQASSGIAWIEPGAVPRRNRAGRDGALLLSILLDRERNELLAAPRVIADPLIAHDATRAVVEMLNTRDSLSATTLHCHVLELWTRVERSARDRLTNTPKWLAVARDYVHAHYSRTIELGEVANAAGVTVPHLARCFRARYGLTIGDYARRLRILAAAEQLSRGRETLAAISLNAGFFDQSHFSREFRRQLGITPTQFRRTIVAKP